MTGSPILGPPPKKHPQAVWCAPCLAEGIYREAFNRWDLCTRHKQGQCSQCKCQMRSGDKSFCSKCRQKLRKKSSGLDQ